MAAKPKKMARMMKGMGSSSLKFTYDRPGRQEAARSHCGIQELRAADSRARRTSSRLESLVGAQNYWGQCSAGLPGQVSGPEQNPIVTELAGPSQHLLPATSKTASGSSSLSTSSS